MRVLHSRSFALQIVLYSILLEIARFVSSALYAISTLSYCHCYTVTEKKNYSVTFVAYILKYNCSFFDLVDSRIHDNVARIFTLTTQSMPH